MEFSFTLTISLVPSLSMVCCAGLLEKLGPETGKTQLGGINKQVAVLGLEGKFPGMGVGRYVAKGLDHPFWP